MTISSEVRKAGPYLGNDTATAFPFAFKVFSTADVLVVHADTAGNETTLDEGTDYTVTLGPDQDAAPGGSVTLPSPLPENEHLTITSQVARLQPVELTNNGGFYPKVLNTALDRLTILVQQVAESVSRSVRLALSTPSGVSAELPVPVPYGILGWDGDGERIINADPSGASALAADLASIATGKGGALVGQPLPDGTASTVRDRITTHDTPEVIDFNYSPIYRLESDYDPPVAEYWAFAHTGQSLAEGGVGGGTVAGLSPYPDEVKMLQLGPVGLNTATLGTGITTLTEPSRVTIGSSFMRGVLDNVTTPPLEALFHGQAWGGKNYDALKKGGTSGVYEKVLAQAASIFAARPLAIYKGVSCIHGEQDGLDNNTAYAVDLAEWQADFETDLQAITGQTEDIPLFICQAGSASGYGYTSGIATVAFPSQLQQLVAHKANSKIHLVCPKYQLDYYDHSHITNDAQRLLGEYYAKAFAVVEAGGTWEPLRPTTIVGAGSTVTISFTGRVGNLAFDTTLVASATNYGFAYKDDSSRTITGVSIVNNQVVITLSGTIGANPLVSYAYNNGAGGAANQVAGLGARGNLRDSDTAVSAFDGARLYNWCVIFRESVA
jgi:hypothetical protein